MKPTERLRLMWRGRWRGRLLLGLALLGAFLTASSLWSAPQPSSSWPVSSLRMDETRGLNLSGEVRIPSMAELKARWIQNKIQRLSKRLERLEGGGWWEARGTAALSQTFLNPRVHAFYTASYRNPEEDGEWGRWDRWTGWENYPLLGRYSSKNVSVIAHHMDMMRKAGIGTVVVSWEEEGLGQGVFNALLEKAESCGLKVSLQIEDYPGRLLSGILNQLQKFLSTYGSHPALYRHGINSLPVVYIKETFLAGDTLAWRAAVKRLESSCILLAHLRQPAHRLLILSSAFPGFYTWSESAGESFGSSWKNWKGLAELAEAKGLIFVPVVNPAYKEYSGTRRRASQYYTMGWRVATSIGAKIVGVNSFNDWLEGSQIEAGEGYDRDGGSHSYLDITLLWASKLS